MASWARRSSSRSLVGRTITGVPLYCWRHSSDLKYCHIISSLASLTAFTLVKISAHESSCSFLGWDDPTTVRLVTYSSAAAEKIISVRPRAGSSRAVRSAVKSCGRATTAVNSARVIRPGKAPLNSENEWPRASLVLFSGGLAAYTRESRQSATAALTSPTAARTSARLPRLSPRTGTTTGASGWSVLVRCTQLFASPPSMHSVQGPCW